MDYSLDTPFKTYYEIQDAIYSRTATLSYNRSSAYSIACRIHPICVISNLLVPVTSLIMMFIACIFFEVSKWFLLFGIAVLVLHPLVDHLKGLFVLISLLLIVIPLLIGNTMWLFVIGTGMLGMLIGNYIWWGIISGTASRALLTDESLFQSVWCSRGVALKTKYPRDGFYFYHGENGANS